jgi:biotin operon repressor
MAMSTKERRKPWVDDFAVAEINRYATRLKEDGVNASGMVVLIGMASHMRIREGNYVCFAGADKLAEELPISEKTVRRAIKHLVEVGYLIDLQPKEGEGVETKEALPAHGRSNAYSINLPCFSKADPVPTKPVASPEAKELTELFFQRLGSPEKWASHIEPWSLIFTNLLKSFFKGHLEKMIDHATGNEHWIGQLMAEGVDPAEEFNKRSNEISDQVKKRFPSRKPPTTTATKPQQKHKFAPPRRRAV